MTPRAKDVKNLAARLALSLLLLGCGEDSSPTGGGGPPGAPTSGSTGAGGGGGAAGGASSVPIAPACVEDGEPTYQPFDDDIPRCECPAALPLPEEAFLVDLTDTAVGSPGTCGPFAAFVEDPLEIDPTIPFPQVLRLPALQGADPACQDLCDVGPDSTAFGLTIVYPGLAEDPRIVTVRVPPPWFLVIGNEHSPTPCLDGRPSTLEYGQPLACAATGGNDFGFATADPNAPSVDVLVDTFERGALASPSCCPYTCSSTSCR